MPKYIIHKDGAYNFFTTVADGACYEEALTLDEVMRITDEELGETGVKDLPGRLERAHRTGCSGVGWSLDDCLASNRQGPDEARMPAEEFIRRFLTLRPSVQPPEERT